MIEFVGSSVLGHDLVVTLNHVTKQTRPWLLLKKIKAFVDMDANKTMLDGSHVG